MNQIMGFSWMKSRSFFHTNACVHRKRSFTSGLGKMAGKSAAGIISSATTACITSLIFPRVWGVKWSKHPLFSLKVHVLPPFAPRTSSQRMFEQFTIWRCLFRTEECVLRNDLLNAHRKLAKGPTGLKEGRFQVQTCSALVWSLQFVNLSKLTPRCAHDEQAHL